MLLPDILLVHGAWHGSWCWELVTAELRRLGRTAHAVDLPSSGSPAGLLRPQSARSATDRLRAAGWLTIPSDNDKTMPPAPQEEMAARASSVQHLPSSHSPFLSVPADLAALLDQVTFDQARVRS